MKRIYGASVYYAKYKRPLTVCLRLRVIGLGGDYSGFPDSTKWVITQEKQTSN